MKFINKKLFIELMDYLIMTNDEPIIKNTYKEIKDFIDQSKNNDSIRLFLNDRIKRDLKVDKCSSSKLGIVKGTT